MDFRDLRFVEQICGEFERAVDGVQAPSNIEVYEDPRRNVSVLCAQPYNFTTPGQLVKLDMAIWTGLQANARVKTLYFVVDPSDKRACLAADVLREDAGPIDPVPLVPPTLFPKSISIIPAESVPRSLAANAMHHSLILALIDELSCSLLGWMCINPADRRANMPSDIIDIRVFPYTGTGYPDKTVLVVAQVTLSAADGRFAVSSRTIDSICLVAAPTKAISVSQVVVSPSAADLLTYLVTFHIIVGVIQTDQVFARDVSLSGRAVRGPRKRTRDQRDIALDEPGVSVLSSAPPRDSAYHSASEEEGEQEARVGTREHSHAAKRRRMIGDM